MAGMACRSILRRMRTQNPFTSPIRSLITSRSAAIKETLLRALRAEISYVSDHRTPSEVMRYMHVNSSFESFSIDPNPGEKWVRLTKSNGSEQIKIDASLIDGFAPSTRSGDVSNPQDVRLHISLAVEVARSDSSNGIIMQFLCSAWPDSLDIDRVFAAPSGLLAIKPYTGPSFKDLEEEMQNAAREYLEERGVNDELAEFLHKYAANKDRDERVRWLRNIESYVKK